MPISVVLRPSLRTPNFAQLAHSLERLIVPCVTDETHRLADAFVFQRRDVEQESVCILHNRVGRECYTQSPKSA